MIPNLALTSPLVEAPPHTTAPDAVTVQQLTSGHTAEVLAFLAERPLHTVCMSSMIRDNGVESPLNRGSFYACRNREGQLEGVALIGHATVFETRTDEAIAAFARIAQNEPRAFMLMGEQEKVKRFWQYFSSENSASPRLMCRELLFEQRWPVEVHEAVRGLRPATLDDIELVVPVHAEMAEAESGVNPLEVDPIGFRMRCARRIEQGRVWVLIEDGRLIFKADAQAETPQVIYLEGVYVNPQDRGKGYGLRCLSQLSRGMLQRAGSICLLVNENNRKAHTLYLSAGYKLQGYYDTIFLQTETVQG
jgi:uncharacterized protein